MILDIIPPKAKQVKLSPYGKKSVVSLIQVQHSLAFFLFILIYRISPGISCPSKKALALLREFSIISLTA